MAASVYKQKTLNSGVVMTKNVLLATAAFAIASAAAVPAQAGNWSGLYIGGHAGGLWGDVDVAKVNEPVPMPFDGSANGTTTTYSPSGVLGGAQLGYNYQMSNLVFGLELSGSATEFNKSAMLATDDLHTVNSDWNASAVLRAGYAFSYGALVYLKGGYAIADLQHSMTDSVGASPNGGSYSDSENIDGYTVGAGYEYLISSDVSVGLDYAYADYGTSTFEATADVPADGSIVHEIDAKTHTVTARLNWHFNP
jgi:outer membrane immunogenic protein